MSLKSIEGASSSSWWKYDVFVSFRGEDTRKNFTGHLFKALEQRGMIIFRDDEKLERGKPISPELLKAIEHSRFYIVVFSSNYATSSWCLDELAKIVECMKENGRTLFPVFYHVNPANVRKQTGSFGEAFEKHEKSVKAEKLQRWREALTEVANLSGWDLQDRDEVTFIQEIVEKIWTKLSQHSFSSATKGLVGIDSVLKDMNTSHLEIGFNDVRIIGISGMGGIGKTTIAKAIYEKYSHQFEGSSFVSIDRDVSEKLGLAALQEQVILETLMEKNTCVRGVRRGIHKWLRNKRVMIVLDDIDKLQQLETLVGDHDWFGPGSRIIVTTRDEHLLIAHGIDKIYKVNCLGTEEALELFSLRAFKSNHPTEGYEELSKDIVTYCNGLPLALVVLGSSLYGKKINKWRSEFQRLKATPRREIFDILKISYDGLEETEKKIFLDISCLFNMKKVNRVIEILDACDLYPEIGLEVLVDKSLISIMDRIDDNCVNVHNLLQEMARTIVLKESPSEPGERSRLWLYDDIYHVLTTKMGTKAVEVIYLSSSQLKEIFVDPDAFVGMNNLRLHKVHNIRLPKGLDCLPNKLRILKWHGYPLKSLPSTFKQGELVELDMSYSGIVLLWKERVHLDKLKVITLSHSRKLTTTPDFKGVPNLERLVLEGCTSLYEVHPSIGSLERLILLNLKDCESLQSLPRIVLGWRSLKVLLLLGCSKIDKLPENLGDCEDLEELDVGKTAIIEPPSSIVNLKKLKMLSFGRCKGKTLKRKRWNWFLPLLVGAGPSFKSLKLPSQMAGLLALTELDLSYCNLSEETIPSDFGNLSALQNLNLSGNVFVALPASINQLSRLECLKLNYCKKLQTLTELPSSIQDLYARNCSSLKTLISPLGLLMSSDRYFEIQNCFRLLENQGGEDVALSLLKQHLLFLAKTRIGEIFSFFLDSSEKQESNNPHVARLVNVIRSWMTYLPQQVSDSSSYSSELSIFLPGSSISDWFTFLSTNNWISIDLPPNWVSDCTFLGLAVCATFGLKDHKGQEQIKREREGVLYDFMFHFSPEYLNKNGTGFRLEADRLPLSDHRWLLFLPPAVKQLAPEMNRPTFIGYFSIADPGFELKKCSIRAVYLKDIEFIQTMFQGPSDNVPRLEDIIQLTQPQAAGSDDAGPSGTDFDTDEWPYFLMPETLCSHD